MSDKDLQSVNAATGQFPALTPIASTTGGSSQPASGNNLPSAEAPRPDLKELAASLNVASQSVGRNLRFEVDLDRNRAVIHVVDKETGETIRQIPPEKAKIYLADGGEMALRLLDANA